MHAFIKRFFWFLLIVGLPACAGFQRSCASSCAEGLGADWVIVQLNAFGEPIRRWQLENVSIANEPSSDGIYWQDPAKNLVHISGQYNRVQVFNGGWEKAFASLHMKGSSCAENLVDLDKARKPEKE